MHVMLDIETLGKKPGCVVLSIGACAFNPFGDGYSYEFYQNIDPKDGEDVWGLSVDPDTVRWWKGQSEESRAHLVPDRIGTMEAAYAFGDWFKSVNGKEVWCQGATFDVPIMDAVFSATGQIAPWKYYDVRDTRTIYDICGLDPRTVKHEGTYHNALDDAIHQVKCVQEALKQCTFVNQSVA